MLTTIREKTQGIIAAIIVGMLILVFALWGVNSYFEGTSKTVVAEGEGITLTADDVRRAVDRYRGQVQPSILESKFFKQQILEGLLSEELLQNNATDIGMRIDNEQLSAHIRDLPYFQRDGAFNPELYRETLRSQSIPVAQYEAGVRADLLTEQLRSGFRDTAFVTDAERDAVLRLMLQRREVAEIRIDPAKYARTITPTEQQIEAHYQANAKQYMSPEQVQIEYVEMSAEDLGRGYKPDEAALRAAYKEGVGQKSDTREKRRISHILIPVPLGASAEEEAKAKAEIERIAKRLREGADFAMLARKYSKDPGSAAKGGDLGYITPGLMVKEFEEAAYKLKEGEVSPPVRTKFGFHLLKLTDLKVPQREPFAAVKDNIAKILQRQHGEERFFDLAEQFYNLVYEHPDSLSTVAHELGLKIQKSGWFGRRGGQGFTAQPKVISAAFDPAVLEQGRNSETLELSDTHIAALHVVGHRAAQPLPLAQVSAQIKETLRKAQAREQAAKVRDEVLAALREGQDVAAVARRFGLHYEKPRRIARRVADEKQAVDPRLEEAVYRTPRPEGGKAQFGAAALGGDKGFVVFAVREVIEGDPAKADTALRQRVDQLLAKRRGLGYFDSYRMGVRQTADIQIYPEHLD